MSFVNVADLRKVLDVPDTIVSDADLQGVIDGVDAVIEPLLTQGEDHTDHANVREAALGMSVQVWQARHAPGGQLVGLDLNPQLTPHLLGPGLIQRFLGLLGPCTPYGGSVVA